MRTNNRYGWLPDHPDQRDFLFSALQPAVAIPAAVDLRSGCSSVENQGNLGSCTANALVGALEFLEIKKWKKYANLSRLFVYYNERVIEDSVESDSGAMIRDGIKSLAKQGVCLETTVPYNINHFTLKPSTVAYKEALLHQIKNYYRINSLNELLVCLASGFPVVFGFTVYDSFESPEVAKTGVVPMPKLDESVIGGHAVLAVGYDQASKRVTVRNSWGADWGMSGYFTMPYDYFVNRGLSSDLWTIRTANV
jgi:C1A family cysteine protease